MDCKFHHSRCTAMYRLYSLVQLVLFYFFSSKIAVDDLREEIQEQSNNSASSSAALLLTANEMATTMDTIMRLLE